MTIEFSDTLYVFSHDKAPRGRGAWVFSVTRDWENDDRSISTARFRAADGYHLSLKDAKKKAAEHFARAYPGHHHLTVHILP